MHSVIFLCTLGSVGGSGSGLPVLMLFRVGGQVPHG